MIPLSFLNAKVKIIIFCSIIVGSGILLGYRVFFRDEPGAREVVTVRRGSVVQEVHVTGKMKASEAVDLAFERSGKIARVDARVGDRVVKGSVLMVLDQTELQTQYEEALASTAVERARLAELRAGTRSEEIVVAETAVANAKIAVVNARQALEDAKQNLVDKLRDTYTKSDDAVRNKADQLFYNPQTNSPQLSFSLTDSQLKTDIEWRRLLLESLLKKWQQSENPLTTASDLAAYFGEAKNNLEAVKVFLNSVALAANNPTNKPSNISQTIWDGWRADVATARTNINTAISNLSSADENVKTKDASVAASEGNLQKSQNELALKKGAATPETVAAQEARIAQADAKTKTIVAQIEKTVLRSPIAGVVTKAEGSAGEIVQSGALLVSVLSEQLFEIEANVPESDIGLVQRANKAHVSFDAFSGSVFIGAVALIDPAETVIDGVVNFTINVLLDYPDARFKSGLTADIDIETARRDDVLVIPQAALAEEDDGEFVYKATNGGVVSVPIKIGMRGTDGLVEVAEGLSEGDSIIAVSRMYDDGR